MELHPFDSEKPSDATVKYYKPPKTLVYKYKLCFIPFYGDVFNFKSIAMGIIHGRVFSHVGNYDFSGERNGVQVEYES